MFHQPHGPDPSTDPRLQRLTRVASELATDAMTVNDLGSRLRDDSGVVPTRNILVPADDGSNHAGIDRVAPHGGIIPAP